MFGDKDFRFRDGVADCEMAEPYDVIVIGAGVEGSSTAYQLASRGKKILLLEQVSNKTGVWTLEAGTVNF